MEECEQLMSGGHYDKKEKAVAIVFVELKSTVS